MTHSSSDNSKNNTYIINSEDGAEMVRLIDQNRLITQAMGGLFSERNDLSTLFDVLDIGCGPGGWILDVAKTYPLIEATGIDISPTMINYAKAYAQVTQLPNAHFRVMNALQPLDFPDASFDLINARTIVGFVYPALWPKLIAECQRILRPGGILRLTEAEHGFSNKIGMETLYSYLNRAAFLSGRSFSPTGAHLEMTTMLEYLLRTGGFQAVESKPHILNFSIGTPAHAPVYEDLKIAFQLLQPFLISMKVASKEELELLYHQMLDEMHADDFCALWYFLTAWGKKPS